MSDRSFANEITQIGVQTVDGTGVAATKRLLATGIIPVPANEMNRFVPNGYKYATINVQGKEWTVARISGVGSVTDLLYLISGLFGGATISTPGGTNPRYWTWTPSSTAADGAKKYTVEFGSSVRAEKFIDGTIRNLGIEFTRAGISVTGEMLGQLTQDNQTLSGGASELALKPVLPANVDIYLDTTAATPVVPSTKLTRCFRAGLNFGDKVAAFWPMNSALTSFGGIVEMTPTATLDLLLGADSNGMQLLTYMRAGTTFYVTIKAEMDTIETTYKWGLQWTFAVQVKSGGEKQATDGLTTVPWSLEIVHSPTWTGGAKAMYLRNVVDNTVISAL